MKPATRKAIIRATRKRMQKILGVILPPDLSTARRELSTLGLRGRETRDTHMKRVLRAGLGVGLWSELERVLRERPEPTPQQLEKFFREFEEADLGSMFRPFLGSMLRKLPPFPPGKRPSLTPQQQKEVLAEVRRQTNAGRLTHRAIYEKVAKSYRVHWRTIQNLWTKEQKQIPKGDRE